MKYNKNLQKAIFEIVRNQLNANNPSETRAALERLMERGDDYDEAVRKIAVVVTEEIYDVLKNKEEFNLSRYIEKLKML